MTPPVDYARVRQAAAALLRGGIVGFPTETVYGLGADADQVRAVAAIFAAKGRPPSHPLIVHLAQAAALEDWARAVPPAAYRLAELFWPGPLTLVLPRQPRAHDVVTGGQDSVGLRCPAHPWAQALLQALCSARSDASAAIAAPSANRYGRISPTRAAHVLADLGEKPQGALDYLLDGGDCTLGIESTIVDFASGSARILRPGSIHEDQLGEALRPLGVSVTHAGADALAPRTSGRVAGHYAPRKPLELVPPEHLARRVQALQGTALAVLAPASVMPGLLGHALALFLPAEDTAPAYAHALYASLRRLDESPAQRLLVALPPADVPWHAIHDRLQRAAAGSEDSLAQAD